MLHLREIRLRSHDETPQWPRTVRALGQLETLIFHHEVTIFTGENGSGKSTLLEAVARKAQMIAIGRDDAAHDDSLSHLDNFCADLTLRWHKQTRRGFFLRAEDFFAYSRRLQTTQHDLQVLADRYTRELSENEGENLLRDDGIKRARGHILGQRGALVQRYGENLDARSHGESFLHLFEARLTPNGLYLLDEPEAALSPLRQLAFLSMLKQAVADGCQFIIATHSPILMAYPNAQLLNFNTAPIEAIGYDDIEHVSLLRGFLRDPQSFVHRL